MKPTASKSMLPTLKIIGNVGRKYLFHIVLSNTYCVISIARLSNCGTVQSATAMRLVPLFWSAPNCGTQQCVWHQCSGRRRTAGYRNASGTNVLVGAELRATAMRLVHCSGRRRTELEQTLMDWQRVHPTRKLQYRQVYSGCVGVFILLGKCAQVNFM